MALPSLHNPVTALAMQEGKLPLKTPAQGAFPHGHCPFLHSHDYFLGQLVLIPACDCRLHLAIPARDRCRQGHSLEKSQLWAPSTTGNGWEYFPSLSSCPSIPQAPQILTFTHPGRNSHCYLRTVSQGEK